MATALGTSIEEARRSINTPDRTSGLRYPNRQAGSNGYTGKMITRNVPDRHEALAAELRWRSDIETAAATPGGVAVRLGSHTAQLPEWIHEKARLIEIGIEVKTPDRPGFLRRVADWLTP